MVFGLIYKEDDTLYFCFITLSAHPTHPKTGIFLNRMALKSSGAFKMKQNLVLEQQSVLTVSDYLSAIQMTKTCCSKSSALVPCNSTKEWGWCMREGNWSTQLTWLLHTGNNFRGKFQKRNLIPWQYRQEISLCFLSSRPDLNQAVM